MEKMRKIEKIILGLSEVSLQTIVPALVKIALKKSRQPFLATYLNAHNFNLLFKNQEYLESIQKANFLYADGWGAVFAARLLGKRLPGRLTAKDFFNDFCQKIESEKLSVFLLGNQEKIIRKTAEIINNQFPQIKIKGFHHGFFSKKDEKKIVTEINFQKPDFLIAGLGSPRQEIWLAKNLFRLKIRVGWCVGGLFNFVSGANPACPKLLGDWGFEWFFRLVTEPKRLWRRYLIGGPEFFYRLIVLKLRLSFLKK